MATIEIDRVVVLVLVEENVTDCKAAWYWAGVALPLKVSTPAGVAAADAATDGAGEAQRIARLQRAGRDRHRGTAEVGVAGRYRYARVDSTAEPPAV